MAEPFNYTDTNSSLGNPENSFLEPNTSSVYDNNAHGDHGPSLAFYKCFINVYVDGFLCVLGFTANSLIILVLQRDKSRTSNTIFLQALAVFDIMFLVYVVLYVVLRSIPLYYQTVLQEYLDISPYIVAFVLPYGWTAQTCTIWTVMVIAIDRYIVVSRPLKATVWCTPTHARRVSVLLFLSAIVFNIPRWPHFYYVAFVEVDGDGHQTFVSHLSNNVSLWDENLYRKIYHQSFGIIFLFIIPLTVMITLNVLLVMAVKASIEIRKILTNNSEQKRKSLESNVNLTTMLVILITIFVVCELPDFIASIIGAIINTQNEPIYEYYAPIKEALLVLNSSINFIVYCSLYSRFRHVFLVMIGWRKKPERKILSASLTIGHPKLTNGHVSKEDRGSRTSLGTISSNLNGSNLQITHM